MGQDALQTSPLCTAAGFPTEGCNAAGEKRPLCSISTSILSQACGQLLRGEIAEHCTVPLFHPRPSSPGHIHSNPSSEWELPCLTFLQQSLREETILGACAGWEGAGTWRKRWGAGRHRQEGRRGASGAYLSPLALP